MKVQLPSGFTTGTVLVTVAGRDSNSLAYPAGTQSGSTPSITCVSPDQAASGTTVTVTGKGFGLDPGVGKRSSTTDKISFGNVTALSEANITSWNDTQVVFVVPSTAVNGPLTITRSGATSNAVPLEPSATNGTAPVLTLTPATQQVGQTVTVAGTGFSPGQSVALSLDEIGRAHV